MTPTERLAQLERGENPQVIAKLSSGYAVMADTQFLPGYCLLLAHPMVPTLNDLTGDARAQFLADMARLGDAVKAATGAVRVNYSIYGNLDPFLHAHVVPRYADEDARYRTLPPLSYPPELRDADRFDRQVHGELLKRISSAL
jgi:diadenosine tetraphosphate (Ap4A) HIT family hydrolase